MRKYSIFDGFNSIESLELKLSPTALSFGGLVAAPLVAAHQLALAVDDDPGGDDPLPDPEPPPPPFPGPDPPLGWPPIPPSGPVGPG
jgi:hypothetical protein